MLANRCGNLRQNVMKKASELFEFKSIKELSKDSFYNMQNYSQLIIDF